MSANSVNVNEITNQNQKITIDKNLTLSSFPTRAQIVEERRIKNINNLLNLIRSKMMNATNNSITLTYEELKSYESVTKEVFKCLMVDKDFEVMKTESQSTETEIRSYSYTISW